MSINDDKVVTISDGEGWSNIDFIKENKCEIVIVMENFPVFSDN